MQWKTRNIDKQQPTHSGVSEIIKFKQDARKRWNYWNSFYQFVFIINRLPLKNESRSVCFPCENIWFKSHFIQFPQIAQRIAISWANKSRIWYQKSERRSSPSLFPAPDNQIDGGQVQPHSRSLLSDGNK